jgi:hypothetical protein
MWGWDTTEVYSNIAGRFVVIVKDRVNQIFVAETLLKINDQGFSYG